MAKRALAALVLLAAATAAQEAPSKVERLMGLCRLWGTVKYFHPELGYRGIDWDQALVDTLPKVEQAKTVAEYRAAVAHLLSSLGDPATRVLGSPAPAPAAPPQPRKEGNVAVVTAREWDGGFASQVGRRLRPALARLAPEKAVVLDLRRKRTDERAVAFAQALRYSLSALLPRDLLAARLRVRIHSGYAPQRGRTSGGYYSGLLVQDGEILRAGNRSGAAPRLVFVTNAHSGAVFDVAAGLRDAGLAAVVHVGPPPPNWGRVTTLTLPGRVVVLVRTGETIYEDGSLAFTPDVLADDASALSRARELARRPLAPKELPRGKAPPSARTIKERPYADPALPSRENRLLALFRFWLVIDYFFPYEHLLDRPWEKELEEFLPRFEAANDELTYHLTVAELVARIRDTHGFLRSPVLTRHFGTHSPPLILRFIDDQLVVTNVVGDEKRVAVGDVIRTVDGKPVQDHVARLAKHRAASTPQAMRWLMARSVLRGAEGTDVKIEVEGADGQVRAVTLKRTADGGVLRNAYLKARTRPVFGVLENGFGYFDLVRLERNQVYRAFDAVRNTPGLIMDMRGYPRGTAWTIAGRFSKGGRPGAQFRRPLLTGPPGGMDMDNSFAFTQPYPEMQGWKYEKPVVVLVNEEAISQSEHSCLLFEAAAGDRLRFVGTPTNGANGDVTNVPLPGGLSVSFSGHDVRHADGRQLQRVGIQPHIRVAPTIAGVRAGKDELMEAAVRHLRSTAPPRATEEGGTVRIEPGGPAFRLPRGWNARIEGAPPRADFTTEALEILDAALDRGRLAFHGGTSDDSVYSDVQLRVYWLDATPDSIEKRLAEKGTRAVAEVLAPLRVWKRNATGKFGRRNREPPQDVRDAPIVVRAEHRPVRAAQDAWRFAVKLNYGDYGATLFVDVHLRRFGEKTAAFAFLHTSFRDRSPVIRAVLESVR